MTVALEINTQHAPPMTMSLRFHKRLPHLNTRKFYEIRVDPSWHDGVWTVSRHWGRLGAIKQSVQTLFADHVSALKDAQSHAKKRLDRGYIYIPEDISPKELVSILLESDRDEPIDQEFQYLHLCINHLVPSELRTVFSSELHKIQDLLISTACISYKQLDLFTNTQQNSVKGKYILSVIRGQLIEALTATPTFTDDYYSITSLRHHFSRMDQNIVRVAIGWQHNFLNKTISAFFWRDEKLQDMMFDLIRHNITFMGQLVQMSEADILPYLANDNDLLEHLKTRLASIGTSQAGLSLNMKAPRWTPPDLKAHFSR